MNPASPGGAQPWLAIAMLMVASALLIATVVLDEAHSFARFLIVGLWVTTSFVAMMKERLMYGLGDRVTLFGTALTLAVTISAALLDRNGSTALVWVSALSILAAVILAAKVLSNVLQRSRRVADDDA